MINDQKEQEIIGALQHVLIRLDKVDTEYREVTARLTEIEKRLGLIGPPKIGQA